MATKYILHGGFAQHLNSQNDNFFKEILKDTKKDLKILLVEFAHDKERYLVNTEKDSSQFIRVKEDKNLFFEVATVENFLDQVGKADVIYISGGKTIKLMQIMQQFSNLKEFFSEKIVAGESAGANCLSTYCYSKSGGGITKGLGLVPIKIIPHYNGEYYEELEKIPEKLDMLFLKNYQFKVFYI